MHAAALLTFALPAPAAPPAARSWPPAPRVAVSFSAAVEPTERSVTELLASLRDGEAGAYDALVPRVYQELQRIARRQIASEPRGSTLSATGLVHEAFLKLIGQAHASFNDRAHFLSVAAVVMRRILVDRARARLAGKRGGGQRAVTLEDQIGLATDAEEVLAIDDLLVRLEELSARQGKIVALRFYGGLTDEEIAEAIGVSLPTVRRDWRVARAWLSSELDR
jgi:RNA polymerase sigma factor (TIGR02999 family)